MDHRVMREQFLSIKRFFIGLAAVVIACGSVVSPGISHSQERKSLRVAFVTLAWNSEIPLRVALALVFFKSQGLELEPIYIRGGPAVMAALVSGAIDFATVGGAQAVIRARAHGLDVSIVGSISNRTNYVLLGNKQTRSVDALKGKTIGITGVGGFSEFTMRAYLKKQRIDPSNDVILRAVGNTTVGLILPVSRIRKVGRRKTRSYSSKISGERKSDTRLLKTRSRSRGG
jgi:ABC-type nitrate/sulfonate/bicarbonate transport system substrate-binding protein